HSHASDSARCGGERDGEQEARVRGGSARRQGGRHFYDGGGLPRPRPAAAGGCGALKRSDSKATRSVMKANVFRGTQKFGIEEVEQPRAGVGEAVVRIALTTICGTDLHIVRGEYPVKPGLVIGHEPVGVIAELGPGVEG